MEEIKIAEVNNNEIKTVSTINKWFVLKAAKNALLLINSINPPIPRSSPNKNISAAATQRTLRLSFIFICKRFPD